MVSSNPDDRPDELDRTPDLSKADLADTETTSDIQDVFDAIQLRSTVTHERSDGTLDLDPSWAQSVAEPTRGNRRPRIPRTLVSARLGLPCKFGEPT